MLLVVAHSLLALLCLWVVVEGCALLLEKEDFVLRMNGLRRFLEFFRWRHNFVTRPKFMSTNCQKKNCFVCLLSVKMQSVRHFTSVFWEQKYSLFPSLHHEILLSALLH